MTISGSVSRMPDITITTSLEGITPAQLTGGFFEHWPSAPSPERHLDLLRGSYAVALALDVKSGSVAGFATAVGDGVLAAYIPLLEVSPPYRGHGIGSMLVMRLIKEVSPCYMIDVACDDDVVAFYERLGFTRGNAMIRRDYAAQSAALPGG